MIPSFTHLDANTHYYNICIVCVGVYNFLSLAGVGFDTSNIPRYRTVLNTPARQRLASVTPYSPRPPAGAGGRGPALSPGSGLSEVVCTIKVPNIDGNSISNDYLVF